MTEVTDAYCPFYCEENIWVRAAMDDALEVWWISNHDKKVVMAHQQAGHPVVWDYHVILLLRTGEVLDFDSTLGLCTDASTYLTQSFPLHSDMPGAPLFRVLSAQEYRHSFYSDRTHMPPDAPRPRWPMIRPEQGNCIQDFCNFSLGEPGICYDFESLYRKVSVDA